MSDLSELQARRRIHAWIVEASEGTSTQAIAKALGVRWNTAKDWKTGRCTPEGAKLLRLARFLDAPLGDLDEEK